MGYLRRRGQGGPDGRLESAGPGSPPSPRETVMKSPSEARLPILCEVDHHQILFQKHDHGVRFLVICRAKRQAESFITLSAPAERTPPTPPRPLRPVDFQERIVLQPMLFSYVCDPEDAD